MITERSVIRKININRSIDIIHKACQQCNRVDIPKIMEPDTIKNIINKLQKYNIIVCQQKKTSLPNKETFKSKKNAFMIGPEGGFSKTETKLLETQTNVFSIKLSDTILRAETAAISAASSYYILKNSTSTYQRI